jgi:hypothetical protein
MSGDDFDTDQIREHVKSRQTWVRFLYMVIFLFFAWVASFIFPILVLVLFLTQLFTGQANRHVREFAGGFAAWAYQVIRFLTYNQEALPFPFDRWPAAEAERRQPSMAANSPKCPPVAISDIITSLSDK